MGARGGLLVPRESILCPFTATLALATEAVVNGVELRLHSRVVSASNEGALHALDCGGETVEARFVVNAAGLQSDTVEALFGRLRTASIGRGISVSRVVPVTRGRSAEAMTPGAGAATLSRSCCTRSG